MSKSKKPGTLIVEFKLVCMRCFEELEFDILEPNSKSKVDEIAVGFCKHCVSKIEEDTKKKLAEDVKKFIISKKEFTGDEQ